MKIFDCFMYFDEDLLLDLRLNILDSFVDKFIIVPCFFIFPLIVSWTLMFIPISWNCTEKL